MTQRGVGRNNFIRSGDITRMIKTLHVIGALGLQQRERECSFHIEDQTCFRRNHKKLGHVSAGHGILEKHRKRPGGRGNAGGMHHLRILFERKYNLDYFDKTPHMLVPCDVGLSMAPLEVLVPFIREARFGNTLEMQSIVYDASQLFAFVKRWRLEINTFHLPLGISNAGMVGAHGSWWKMFLVLGPRQLLQTNNIASLRWVPLLEDFDKCSRFSWGSVVLCSTYHALSYASNRATREISGFLPLVYSWIYQRFPRWCPYGRECIIFPLVVRLCSLGLTSRDHHVARILRL
ncbi:hypothetical protein PIB30_040507 [Stylosanthes scabra]|uniref:Aminotransferase-like plant mobile domain-containing protein n=1 Tax=Stylosanthes scabra TaxID=79078 RepID=A0ABU6QF50_9FABA|nr:hypothetical protein [Stylosanthes scabra]